MSRRGDCLANAPMESFFASLKEEHVHPVRFRTREEAKAAVFDYIEPGFPRWIGSTGPKAAAMLAALRIPSFTRRVRQDSATWFTGRC